MNLLLNRIKLSLITIPLHKLKWMGSLESQVVKKEGNISDGAGKHSVYFFSTHKCASTFLNSLAKNLADFEDKNHIDIETYLATNPQKRDELYASKSFSEHILSRKGYYFGVFRYPFSHLPQPSNQKIVLVLRDPRDILTSQYFSIAYSHPVLTFKFIQKRKNALEIGIDRHVIEMSDRFLNTYNGYLKNYIGRNDVLLVKYEDMVSDFGNVLVKILDFIEHPEMAKALSYWTSNNPFVINGENAARHRRKITPGDHKEKLKNETISFLNEKFKYILQSLGYNA